jgi:hypothetical protein
MSQQAVSADTIANLADGIFSQNQKEENYKQQRYTDKMVATEI